MLVEEFETRMIKQPRREFVETLQKVVYFNGLYPNVLSAVGAFKTSGLVVALACSTRQRTGYTGGDTRQADGYIADDCIVCYIYEGTAWPDDIPQADRPPSPNRELEGRLSDWTSS